MDSFQQSDICRQIMDGSVPMWIQNRPFTINPLYGVLKCASSVFFMRGWMKDLWAVKQAIPM